jgi:hypothetical protein
MGSMKKNPIALAIAALAFVGWMIFLGFEARQKSNPVVVSRAQLLVSQFEVEVDLEAEPKEPQPAEVTVRDVLYSAEEPKPKGVIAVTNLNRTQGYVGPGAYLLPLVRHGNQFEVAGYPPDPGLPAFHEPPKPRIYPLTSNVRQQYQQIRSP